MILPGLTACHKKNKISYEPGVLPCKVYGASDEAIIKMQASLNKSGVRVITIGQNYLISIPSVMLFADQSPRLRWASYALLNNVACYLKQFRKVAITITGYSSKCVSYQRERALTLARTRAVGDYLWSQDINSRFIFTQGLGSDKPLMSYSAGGDASPNSRIEITFRRAIV
ncbi:type IVB secretion system protein IcmN/DotK [Legionella israelensis]|uniref:type IVB secretion system protein IcmN/DotK n=1 Tax=Legionella israelensis TaxID=454 RepID=UPI003CC91E24